MMTIIKACPVVEGERLIVQGLRNQRSVVKDVKFIATEARWMITLDWGEFGTSHVYDTDEHKTWYRYSTAN